MNKYENEIKLLDEAVNSPQGVRFEHPVPYAFRQRLYNARRAVRRRGDMRFEGLEIRVEVNTITILKPSRQMPRFEKIKELSL